MSEPTMAERDAERIPGWYWILTPSANSGREPEWEVAMWSPSSRCFGPGWLIAGDESDVCANQILEVDERPLVRQP